MPRWEDHHVIRDASPADAPLLHRICLMTGDAGRDATALHADADLLGQVYVDPYLHVAPAVAAVATDEGGTVLGYVLGTPDTATFLGACEAHWWPALRDRHPLDAGGHPRTAADQSLVELIHNPHAPDPELVATYPAHLHIDLLPEAQGQGLGRALIDWLLDRLAALGAHGVHLGVDPRNTAAIAFYERLGFTRWGSDPDAVVLVRQLG
jgi:ribosomal protein S18 acetylase RimI-like enzyme